jgi:hypothetical protein
MGAILHRNSAPENPHDISALALAPTEGAVMVGLI